MAQRLPIGQTLAVFIDIKLAIKSIYVLDIPQPGIIFYLWRGQYHQRMHEWHNRERRHGGRCRRRSF